MSININRNELENRTRNISHLFKAEDEAYAIELAAYSIIKELAKCKLISEDELTRIAMEPIRTIA